jgi:hypothetical protein
MENFRRNLEFIYRTGDLTILYEVDSIFPTQAGYENQGV